MKVKNGIRYDMNGWVYVSIKGTPWDRGYAYGLLIAKDMKRVMETIRFIVYNDYGVEWQFFVDACTKYYTPKIKENFQEFYEEMEGFAKGAAMSVEEVVAWNNYFTLTESFWANLPEELAISIKGSTSIAMGSKEGGGQQERCSAFIATGSDWTGSGSE